MSLASDLDLPPARPRRRSGCSRWQMRDALSAARARRRATSTSPISAPASATFVAEVVFQTRTIRERPVVGLAHLFVFWGFCAFGGYTTVEALHGPRPRRSDRHTRAFALYRLALVPFSVAVLAGIVLLFVRRAFLRPARAGRDGVEGVAAHQRVHRRADDHLPRRRRRAARGPRWPVRRRARELVGAHAGDPHLHGADSRTRSTCTCCCRRLTVFLRSPVLGTVPKLDFEKEEVGLETVQRPADEAGARRLHLRRVRPLPGQLSGASRPASCSIRRR